MFGDRVPVCDACDARGHEWRISRFGSWNKRELLERSEYSCDRVRVPQQIKKDN